MKKRIINLLMCVFMVLSMLPASALAFGSDSVTASGKNNTGSASGSNAASQSNKVTATRGNFDFAMWIGSQAYYTFEEGWTQLIKNGGGSAILSRDWVADDGSFGTTAGAFENGMIKVPDGITIELDLNGNNVDRGLTSSRDNGSVFKVGAGAKRISQ